MKLVSCTELAKILGLTKQAISLSVKQGKLRPIQQGKRYKIDLHDAMTISYMKEENNRRPEFHKETYQKKEEIKPTREEKEAEKRNNFEQARAEANLIRSSASPGYGSKQDYDIKRIEAATRKINIEVAQKMNILILRDTAERVFSKINATVINTLHPMGDRLSPVIAGITECTDNKKIIEIKKLIDDEIMRAIADIKYSTIQDLKNE